MGANKILRPACYSQTNRSIERRFDSYLRCEGQPHFAMCPGLPENSRDASHTGTVTQGTDIRVPMGLKGMRKGLPEEMNC